MPEWRPGFGPSHGRYWNTRFSTSSVSRTFFAFAYGPKYQTPGRCRSRVNITRGYSSSTVTAMYGNDLSSRSRTLNGGRWRLTRFCSRCRASTSFCVTITSISVTRSGSWRIAARESRLCWKYERTRGRKDVAALVAEEIDAGPRRQRFQLIVESRRHLGQSSHGPAASARQRSPYMSVI